MITLLTPTGGILGPIASLLGIVMNAIYVFFSFFGIQNIALSIFIFTFLMRAAMLPLTIKQQKFTKLSSRMNPELQKIQAKYKGKKDEVSIRKMQAENQALYEKYGANPTSGCLPVIIQLPIMFSLYYVISNIPAYVEKVKHMYEPIAEKIFANHEYASKIIDIAKASKLNVKMNVTDSDHIINILAKFGDNQWKELSSKVPQLSDIIGTNADKIHHTNNFFGLNIANNPGLIFPAILIPIIAAGLQFIQGKQMQMKTPTNKESNPAASAMNSMNIIMPIMSLFFCISFPIGIGLYWIAGSLFAIIQQYFVNKYLDKVNVDELIEKNVSKAMKKSKNNTITGVSMRDIAKTQTKSIDTTMTEKNEADSMNQISESTDNNQTSNAPKSISDIANLLKNKNL